MVGTKNLKWIKDYRIIQGDAEEFGKPPVDSDLVCSVILPGQEVATVVAHQRLDLSEQSTGGFYHCEWSPCMAFSHSDRLVQGFVEAERVSLWYQML